MENREKETLPEAKKVTVEIDINEASECLKYLPSGLEIARREIEEGIKHAEFWNFSRNCQHLEFSKADFHLTGLMAPPAWYKYCKHPENKGGTAKLYIEGLKEVRNKITGECSRENCPVYKG